jgi:tetratricopeptide (TPR) repeat protein
MRNFTAAFAMVIVAFAVLAAACSSVPPPPSTGKPGASVEPAPAPLTEAEKERMELDAIYRAMETGDLASAVRRLGTLISLKPDERSYPVLRASVLLSMGNIEEARAGLEAELKAYPDNVDAMYALGELMRFAGDAKGHRGMMEAIVAKDPKNADAQASIGDIHYEGKNYTKAEQSYAAALAANPAHVEALIGKARVQYRRDDTKGALKTLDKAVEAAPGNPIAYLDRSRVLYDLGRYAECEVDLDKAVELAPGSAWNYVERGRLYMDTGRKPQAMSDFSKSIELEPDYFLPYVYRAAVYEDRGDDELAFADYSRATSLYPDYWYSFESMGVLAYRLGRWTDSFTAFDRAAGYTKFHGEYYVAAALSLLRAGEAKASREYAGKKISMIDKEKYATQWLALRLLYDQNDMTTELELRMNAEKSKDVKAGMLFYLGAYWLARGKVDLGATYIRMSVDEKRIGTIEHRMAEADLTRLPVAR